MKKLLLTFAAVLGFCLSSVAATVTWDFEKNAYGLPNDQSTYVTTPTTLTSGDVSITLNGNDKASWRYWTDGLRVYRTQNPTITVTVATGNITGISWQVNNGVAFTDVTTGGSAITSWSGNAKSVTLYGYPGTGNAAIKTFTVTTDAGGGEITPDPDDPDEPTPGPGSDADISFNLNAETIGVTAASGYKTSDITFTTGDNTYVLNNVVVNSNNLQARGNQATVSSNFYLYNTTPIENIKEVRITVSSGAGTIGATLPISSFGAAAQTEAISSGTTATKDDNVLVFTAPTSGTSYFRVQFLNKSTSGTCQVNKVEIITENISGKETATVVYSEDAVNAYLGQAFTAPTLTVTPEAALSAVSYSSSNEQVATVDESGNVTLGNVLGATTITASIADNDKYTSASDSYTLNVIIDGTYTVAQALQAIENGFTGQATVKGYIIDIEEVSTSYGNATYTIADTSDAETGLQVYRGFGLDGAKFTSEDEIALGALVTVEGNLILYGGYKPEVETGNKMISYEAPAPAESTVTFNVTGDINKCLIYTPDFEEVDFSSGKGTFTYTGDAEIIIFVEDGKSTVTFDSQYNDAITLENETADEFSSTKEYKLTPAANGAVINVLVEAGQIGFDPGRDITLDFNLPEGFNALENLQVYNASANEQLIDEYFDGSLSVNTESYEITFMLKVAEGYELSVKAPADAPASAYSIENSDYDPNEGAENGDESASDSYLRLWVDLDILNNATFEVTVTEVPQEPAIPEDAYVVYYNGVVASNLEQYNWWNATWNADIDNPDGEGVVFQFKPGGDSTAAASMGLYCNDGSVIGSLSNATLNFNYYATGTGKYIIRLTGGGAEYNYTIDVTEENANKWNEVSFNIAEQFENLSKAWANSYTFTKDYVFSIILENGANDASISFGYIYYSNIDKNFVAQAPKAPATVPVPVQPADDVLSFMSYYGNDVQYGIGGWGQSTGLENETIDSQNVWFLTNFNYLGLVNFNLNISDYDYMHVDYWTPFEEGTSFGFVPISENPTADNPLYQAEKVVAGEWNSFDVPLTYWSESSWENKVDLSKISQLKFVANIAPTSQTPYGYIANVYFWKEAQTAEPYEVTFAFEGPAEAIAGVMMYGEDPDENGDEIYPVDGKAVVTYTATPYSLYIGVEKEYEYEIVAPEGLVEGDDTFKFQGEPVTNSLYTTTVIALYAGADGATFTVKIKEPVTYPEKVYVLGNGTGMTWDFPGTEYPVVDGKVTFNLTGVQKFKVSTVSATDWDTFNANAWGTGNTKFGEKVYPNGETLPMEIWGEDQELPWSSDYTITLDFTTEQMTAVAATARPTEAPALYIRGDMNNWGNSGLADTYKFTNVEWDGKDSGVFTWTGKINAGVQFKIADSTWGSYNYGYSSSIKANEEITLVSNGGNMTMIADFDGTVTLTINGGTATAIFEMEGEAPAPEQMFVIGTINGEGWNPTNVAPMEVIAEGVYSITNVTFGENSDSCGFALTAAKGTDANDWNTVNALRFAPEVNDTPAIIGQNPVTIGDRSWLITPGSYNMVFNYKDMTLTIEEYEAPELGDEIEAMFNFTDLNAIYKMNPSIPTAGTAPWEYSSSANWYPLTGTVLTLDNISLNASNGTATGSGWTTKAAIRNAATSTTYRMPKGTDLVVSAPEGYEITEIIFTGSTSGYISYVTLADGQTGTLSTPVGSGSSWSRTWTAASTQALAARAVGAPNEVYFTSTGGGIIQTITVKATKLPEPMVEGLVAEDATLTLTAGETTASTVQVPVSLQVSEPVVYQGFQFDFTVPAGVQVGTDNVVLGEGLDGSYSCRLYNQATNTYRVLVQLKYVAGGYSATEDLVTLTLSSIYGNIEAGDYDMTVSNVIFSTVTGDDIKDIDGSVATLTVEVINPVVELNVESALLMLPSYNTLETNPTMISGVTEGQQIAIVLSATGVNGQEVELTDNMVTVSANVDGITVTWDSEADYLESPATSLNDVATAENVWVINTEGLELAPDAPQAVTVTFTSGEATATYEFTVYGILLGDANDNGDITVADVVTVANNVVNKLTAVLDFPNADVVGGGELNTDDVTAIVNLTLQAGVDRQNIRRQAVNIANNDRLVADNFRASKAQATLGVNLENSNAYSALQATVILPEGMTVYGVTAGPRAAAHELAYNMVDGKVYVILYSLTNASFAEGDGALFNILYTADSNCDELVIEAIHASDARSNGYDLQYEGGLNASATGIGAIEADIENGARYFDVNGYEVRNPEAGQILIRVKGNESTKVLVK